MGIMDKAKQKMNEAVGRASEKADQMSGNRPQNQAGQAQDKGPEGMDRTGNPGDQNRPQQR